MATKKEYCDGCERTFEIKRVSARRKSGVHNCPKESPDCGLKKWDFITTVIREIDDE